MAFTGNFMCTSFKVALLNGEMDFSIAIRTLFIENSKGIYPVGGGIVWDSNVKEEYDEAYQKSKILLNFIEK